jgi:uncharacterized membrane protein
MVRKRGDENVDTKSVALIVVFAALYAIGVVALPSISFNIAQVRLADALLPLSMIFGVPSVIGLSLGTVVANVYGGLGIIDIIGGSIANMIACSLSWYISQKKGITHRFLGTLVETLVITIIVGGYLSVLFHVPLEFGLLGILVGSIIAINILGFILEEAIRRSITIIT